MKKESPTKKNWEEYFNALKNQDWETAKTALQKISRLEKDSPQVFLKLGDIYQRTGETAKAISSYHQSADFQRSQGFSQKAIALYKIILRLDPDNQEAISKSEESIMEIEAAKSSYSLPPISEIPLEEPGIIIEEPSAPSPVFTEEPVAAEETLVLEPSAPEEEQAGGMEWLEPTSVPAEEPVVEEITGKEEDVLEGPSGEADWSEMTTEQQGVEEETLVLEPSASEEEPAGGMEWLETTSVSTEEPVAAEETLVLEPSAPEEEPAGGMEWLEQTSVSAEGTGAGEEISGTEPGILEVPSEEADWSELTTEVPGAVEETIETEPGILEGPSGEADWSELTSEPPEGLGVGEEIEEKFEIEHGIAAEKPAEEVDWSDLGPISSEEPVAGEEIPETEPGIPAEGPAEEVDWSDLTSVSAEKPGAETETTVPQAPVYPEEPQGDMDWIGTMPAISSEELPEDMKELAIPLSEREWISTIPELFSDMSEEEFRNILVEFNIRTFSDKEKVIEEGDSGDSMYIIKSGKAKVVAHLLGKEIELAILQEGDMCGEVAFLTGRPRTASIIADGPVEVYEVSRVQLESIIDRNPEILGRLESFYESHVQDTIKKVIPK